jgi:hypothetical protein
MKIPVTVLEEVKLPWTDKPMQQAVDLNLEYDIKWIEGVPYVVTVV